MIKLQLPKFWLVLLWAILVAVSLYIRPLMPIDETRYAAVAWEMWVRNDFLVPYLNGEAYSHKPPLLFWLMQLSWWLFGVNNWSLRLISPFFALGTLCLVSAVARQLWPERNRIAETVPFILIGFFIWIFFSTLTMFDIMLTFFVLVGMYSLLKLIHTGLSYRYWLLLGLAIGGGIMSKGPVALLHILPIALSAPWWLRYQTKSFYWRHWYGGVLLAFITGAVIALCWALPAGMRGGETYRNAIFLGQTAGRVVDSFAHKSPWWWYLELLPVFILPWAFIKSFWTGAKLLNLQDFGIRFCLAWLVPVFLAFSLVSGKRIHYLLPLMPAIALLISWVFEQAVAVNWQKAHILFSVMLSVIGLLLLLLLNLNNRFQWLVEFSGISPMWGLLLCLIAVLTGFIPIKNRQEMILLVSTVSIIASLVFAAGFFSIKWDYYDTAPAAQKINGLRAKNSSVAIYTGKYHGQFNFAGRFEQPLKVISSYSDLVQYAQTNPDGYILIHYKDVKKVPETLLSYHFRYKNQYLGFILGKTFLNNIIPEAALSR